MIMRITALVTFLALAAATNAQYFSDGWKPGQPVPTAETVVQAPQGTFKPRTPGAPEPPKSIKDTFQSLLDPTNLLQFAPLQSILQRVGINVTDKLEQVKQEQANLWDKRIPLITDNNYIETIVNETLTEEGEKERVWFLVITVTGQQQNGISKFVDAAFDEAYELAQQHGDLPHVRWGRIDYLNVTYLTTKWGIWQAPYLVVLQDRGQTLRFYRTTQIRLTDELLHTFLKDKIYESKAPWKSSFAPGGNREWVMDGFATTLKLVYDVFILIPKWAVYILTGVVGSFLISLLHGSQKSAKPAPAEKPQAKKETTAPASAQVASGPSSKQGHKGRKSAKK